MRNSAVVTLAGTVRFNNYGISSLSHRIAESIGTANDITTSDLKEKVTGKHLRDECHKI